MALGTRRRPNHPTGGPLAAQAVERGPQVLAVRLDRRPALLRLAAGAGAGAGAHDEDSSSLVFLASSIAICGVGGEPFLNRRAANMPARPPRPKRIAATT